MLRLFERYDNKQAHQIPLLENDGKGLAYGIWKCKIKLEKPFKFRTGRRDCIPDPAQPYPYITTKEENHFNPHSNGKTFLIPISDQKEIFDQFQDPSYSRSL